MIKTNSFSILYKKIIFRTLAKNINEFKFFTLSLLKIGPKALRWALIGLCASIAFSIIELSLATFIQIFLQSIGVIQGKSVQYFKFFQEDMTPKLTGSILIVIVGLRSICQYLQFQYVIGIQEFFLEKQRRCLVHKMLTSDFQNKLQASYCHHLMGSIFNPAMQFASFTIVTINQLMQASLLILFMFILAPVETLMGLIGIGVIGSLSYKINSKVRTRAKQVPIENQQLSEGVERISKNWLTIWLLGMGNLEFQKLSQNIQKSRANTLLATSLFYFSSSIIPFLGFLLIIFIMYICSQNNLASSSSILLPFIYLFLRFIQNLSSTASSFGIANQFSPQFKEAIKFLDEEINQNECAIIPCNSSSNDKNFNEKIGNNKESPSILIENLNYLRGQVSILRDINAFIKANTYCFIYGPSGCGKSTLVLLILGILKPNAGKIELRYHGDLVKKMDVINALYIGPEPHIIKGTIRENLSYGLSSLASDSVCFNALKQVALLEVIKNLSNGLEYNIQEDGTGLSQGQKQRLCIARAFMRQLDLLILDEATSNLDRDSELIVFNSIKSFTGSLTVIVISHNFHLSVDCDSVILFENQGQNGVGYSANLYKYDEALKRVNL